MKLDDLRNEIDEVDGKMASLFAQRMDIAAQIAQYKKNNSVGVKNTSREREVLARVAHAAGEKYSEYIKTLYLSMFELSRAYQNTLIAPCSKLSADIDCALQKNDTAFPKSALVACQGVEGAYSQIACDRLFTSYPEIVYFKNFGGVFEAVEKGFCEYGILPIENSFFGSVNAVYDLMRRHEFHIVRSLRLKINHSLLVKPGESLCDVKEIFSHEQAIGQCSEFLAGLTNVKVTVCENTAAAAKMVSESKRNDVAAISSSECAQIYSLECVSENIQNTDNNYTRFICISKDLKIFPGAEKISLMLALPHKPGSLYSVISKFAALGLNICKIESRPIPESNFEFMFYFDIEAHICSHELMSLLEQLSTELEIFVFLGAYSEV